VVRDSALVGMGDGTVIIIIIIVIIIPASLLAGVGAVPWVRRPDVWMVSSVSTATVRSISVTVDVKTKLVDPSE